jgi:hypothetical protein
MRVRMRMRMRSSAVWLAIVAALAAALALGWWGLSAHHSQWLAGVRSWTTPRPIVSDRTGIIISASLLTSYFFATMLALFSRRGRQSYGDANARGWMTVVAIVIGALGLLLAIAAFFHISWLIHIVGVLAVLPALTMAYNALVDGLRKLRRKRDVSRSSDS